MPQVIAPIISYGLGAAFGVSTVAGSAAAAIATVGSYVVTGTILTAASKQLNKLAPKPALRGATEGLKGNDISTRFEPSFDIMRAGRVIYGRDKVGHTVRLRHKAGDGGKYLYYIAVWAFHECDAIEEEWLGDELLTFDGSGNATGTYAGLIRRTHHLGTHDQTADANFLAEIPTIHTAAHRGRGVCWTAYRFTWDQTKFPGGLQNLKAVIRGRKLYDPREVSHDPDDASTWAWSANALLCRYDYCRGVPMPDADGNLQRLLGLRLADTRFNEDVLIASANACDEAVPLAGGGSEPRYELHGSFDCDSDHPSTLASLESADGGRTLFIGGQCYLRSGYWQAPDFDLTEAMARKGQRRTRTPLSRREKFNLVTGSYTSPSDGYQRVPFPTVLSNTFIAQDGGELPRQVDFPFVASSTQAQRLVRQSMLRSRQGIVYQQPCNLMALGALAGENIRLTRERLGWDLKHFELVEGVLSLRSGEGGGVGLVVDVTTQETDSSIFDWSTDIEQAFDPAPNTELPNILDVPNVAGLTLSTSNFKQHDGTIFPRLKIAVNLPANIFVQSGGFTEFEFKEASSSDWLPWTKIRGSVLEEYITDVRSGVEYDVRARHENRFGAVSADWVAESHTVSNDTTAPAVPTGLTATPTPASITLDWDDNPAADAVMVYRVYRGTSSGFTADAGSLVWVGRASQYTDYLVAPATEYFYKVAAVDRSNNESAASAASTGATANPATGNVISYIFRRAASAPATPTGDTPASWFDAPPSGSDALWMSRGEKTSTGTLVGTWSDPVRLNGADGSAGDDGDDGDSIQVEYSIDGSTGWHFPFASGDLFMRQRVGPSASWSLAIRIVGEQGPPGADGADGAPGADGADGDAGALATASNDGPDTWNASDIENDIVQVTATPGARRVQVTAQALVEQVFDDDGDIIVRLYRGSTVVDSQQRTILTGQDWLFELRVFDPAPSGSVTYYLTVEYIGFYSIEYVVTNAFIHLV